MNSSDRHVIVKKQRPVNLELTSFMPASAIASILHRVSGVVFFFALIFVIVAWTMSLQSAESFELAKSLMQGVIGKVIVIAILAALSFHTIIGLRHLVMDMGYWEELESGNLSAKLAIAIWVVTVILAGVWIW
ncbi:succinate dehydrogenase, cytochrome b556 subunit [Psychrosphaera saromensis]|uniref:Succinate dehydrogenase cytochrome b556 subunit n=1 Tax=Psychrosphaera saromensis TaxID=716813 RepID=A0A2S7UX51_9GAMM|nr:succinate dehydrogenase, cytochrome b556 subunit [Psychrosphaera saromensis]